MLNRVLQADFNVNIVKIFWCKALVSRRDMKKRFSVRMCAEKIVFVCVSESVFLCVSFH